MQTRKGDARGVANWAEPGLGKTVSTLTAIVDLINSLQAHQVLVVGPKKVAKYVWTDEAQAWGHTNHLRMSVVIGTERQRLAALSKLSDIYTINVENLQWLEATLVERKELVLHGDHKRSPFDMIVCDECFAKGTKVATPQGEVPIEDLRENMHIVNAVGVDRVSGVHRREVPYAVRVNTKTTSFIASPNHPIFTQRGWVGAQHLRADDYALETSAAMSLVRDGVLPKGVWSGGAAFLRDILLGEMEDEPAGDSGVMSVTGEHRKARREQERVVCVTDSRGFAGVEAGYGRWAQTHDERRARKTEPNTERHGPPTLRTRWQRQGNACTASDHDGSVRSGVDRRISGACGRTQSWLSDLLQDRLCESSFEDRDRGGRDISSRAQGSGLEEGCHAGFVRVDSVEVLEPGHPDLEKLRNADGKLYFYDLSATRHPSYSVGGLLVHNSDLFKNRATKRFKVLKRMSKLANYVVLLTGTPATETLVHLWSQYALLDDGKRLGGTFTGFLGMYFKDVGYQFPKWVLKSKQAEAAIQERVSDITFALKAEDYLQLPKENRVIRYVELDPDERRRYDTFLRDAVLPLANGEVLTAASAGALAIKLAQMANGLIYDTQRNVHVIHRKKLEELELLVAESNNSPLLVGVEFLHDRDMIAREFGAKVFDDKKTTLDGWNAGKFKMMLIHPRSGGHGVNLQHGPGHTLVRYGMLHSLGLFIQLFARLHRSGQKSPFVNHFIIAARNTVDDEIMEAVRLKRFSHDGLMHAMRAYLQRLHS